MWVLKQGAQKRDGWGVYDKKWSECFPLCVLLPFLALLFHLFLQFALGLFEREWSCVMQDEEYRERIDEVSISSKSAGV